MRWRGPAFGDLGDEEAFSIEVRRLDELRLAATELRLEADIALGHGELVVGELRGAVTEYPYREHLWLLLVWALASAERRVEALRVCREIRNLLGDVGIGASPELEEIERRLLDGVPVGQASLRRTDPGRVV